LFWVRFERMEGEERGKVEKRGFERGGGQN
jgi:hypothetical protein